MTRHPAPPATPADRHKLEKAIQVGALCRGADGSVLLITSRGTGRWIIPKGWPMRGRSDADAALCEAWEEAGVQGTVGQDPVGFYHYDKLYRGKRKIAVTTHVYPVTVHRLAETFPESHQRQRRWFSPQDAARRVAEPELQTLLRTLPAPDAGPAG